MPGLLFGRSPISDVTLDGGLVLLRRTKDARSNWTDELPGQKAGGGASTPTGLTIRSLRLVYDDERRDRRADVMVSATPGVGLTFSGQGQIRGAPVTVAARLAADGAFNGRVEGPTLNATITGRADRPYTLSALSARLVARGRDLRDLDALAEAALPGTQPFRLAADLRHDERRWVISGLKGQIGRSTIEGAAQVDKVEDRSKLSGGLHFAALDFDDLASDEGLARAAAKRKETGPRVVPDTAIALDHLQRTDGKLDVRIDRLLWKTPAPFRSITGTLALDYGVLTLSGLRVGLDHGEISGSAKVTQQGKVPTRLTLDLRLSGGRVEDFVGRGAVLAPLRGRIAVQGTGRTVRAAFGTASGKVALAATGGTIDRRSAELIGRNIGRALKARADERAGLRCLIADFRGRGGRFAADPLIVDTAIARADGKGSLDWRNEGFSLSVGGGSKVPAAFRLSGPLAVRGTIKQPKLIPSAAAVSAGGLLKMVGRAIAGDKSLAAPDADCAGLTRRVLQ